MLDVHAPVLHRDGFLHGNDVHTDTRTAHRHHRRDFLQRQEGHALEEHRQLGMTIHQFGVHVGVLGTSRHKHRHPIHPLLPREIGPFIVHCPLSIVQFHGILIPVVVLEHTEIREFVEQVVQTLVVRRIVLLGVHLVQLRVGVVLANLEEIAGQHVQQQIQRCLTRCGIHFVLEYARQAPVLRSIGGHLDFTGHSVRHVTNELQQFRIRILVAPVLRDKLVGHLRHKVLF